MSAVFGEILTFGQANDRDIPLKVTGDEFYATHEPLDGYSAVSDSDRGFFFIVENRSKLGLDTHLPSSGLAVYHCDILGSNEFQQGTGQRHYQCALSQADGNTDLEHNVNQGDGTDLFGSVTGVVLSPAPALMRKAHRSLRAAPALEVSSDAKSARAVEFLLFLQRTPMGGANAGMRREPGGQGAPRVP